MGAVGPLVLKRIEEADDVLAAGVIGLRLNDAVEKLNLVDGGLGVVSGGSNDLEGDVLARVVVAGQPDGGKVTPAKFADDGVLAILEVLADLDGVVAALAVVFGVLLIGCIFGGLIGGGGRGRAGDGGSELLGSA